MSADRSVDRFIVVVLADDTSACRQVMEIITGGADGVVLFASMDNKSLDAITGVLEETHEQEL